MWTTAASRPSAAAHWPDSPSFRPASTTVPSRRSPARHHRSLRIVGTIVATGTIILPATELEIRGGGVLNASAADLRDHRKPVGRSTTGHLIQGASGSRVLVTGDAAFFGGDELGKLSAGLLEFAATSRKVMAARIRRSRRAERTSRTQRDRRPVHSLQSVRLRPAIRFLVRAPRDHEHLRVGSDRHRIRESISQTSTSGASDGGGRRDAQHRRSAHAAHGLHDRQQRDDREGIVRQRGRSERPWRCSPDPTTITSVNDRDRLRRVAPSGASACLAANPCFISRSHLMRSNSVQQWHQGGPGGHRGR